jgi:hypothetical protein
LNRNKKKNLFLCSSDLLGIHLINQPIAEMSLWEFLGKIVSNKLDLTRWKPLARHHVYQSGSHKRWQERSEELTGSLYLSLLILIICDSIYNEQHNCTHNSHKRQLFHLESTFSLHQYHPFRSFKTNQYYS